jgi:phosphate/sulfate permease
LKIALVASSLYVAFSIGANNVAGAAGPIASLIKNELGTSCQSNPLPILILSILVIVPCFAIGGALLGYKGIRNTGKDIVEVTPFYATIIALIVATLLLYASLRKGIPTSLVQLNGGAFIALSIVKKGWRNTFSNKTVQIFFSVWAIAPIFAFTLTFVLMKLFVL